MLSITFLIFVLLAVNVKAYTSTFPSNKYRQTKLNSLINNNSDNIKERVDVHVGNNMISCLKNTAITLVLTASIFQMNMPSSVFADDKKPSNKAFEACYSQCMFEETKPPPVGASTERLLDTKPRATILKECRVRCAKSKDQLMMGKPKAIPTPQKLALPQSIVEDEIKSATSN